MSNGAPRRQEGQREPLSVREQLDDGPHFIPETGTCIACGGFGQCAGDQVDKDTGLGEACWRVWRWSPVREREFPRS